MEGQGELVHHGHRSAGTEETAGRPGGKPVRPQRQGASLVLGAFVVSSSTFSYGILKTCPKADRTVVDPVCSTPSLHLIAIWPVFFIYTLSPPTLHSLQDYFKADSRHHTVQL